MDADRNALQEQVIRFRDSYGRIYAITQELDTLQPEQVFLSTLDVLEDVMQNQSVALYSCADNSSFARLVVHSREMETLPKSMDLKEVSPTGRSVSKGRNLRQFKTRSRISGILCTRSARRKNHRADCALGCAL